MEILKGHVSPATAYLVNDYPYGFRLRCQIRYWLEVHPRLGVRLSEQEYFCNDVCCVEYLDEIKDAEREADYSEALNRLEF